MPNFSNYAFRLSFAHWLGASLSAARRARFRPIVSTPNQRTVANAHQQQRKATMAALMPCRWSTAQHSAAATRYQGCGLCGPLPTNWRPASSAARPARTRRRMAVRMHAAPEDDEAPPVFEDWRAFRAQLVAQQRADAASSSQPSSPAPEQAQGDETEGGRPVGAPQVSESNMALLEMHSPDLASEGVWAHPTPGIEQGGVLLSTLDTQDILENEGLEQVVVVVLSHGPQGSMGLLLSRPTSMVLGKQRGGLRFDVTNAPPDLQRVFAASRVHMGGWTAQNMVHVLHPYPLPSSVQVVPGIYMGGEAAAIRLVESGQVPASQFKFFAGAMVWEPGQLEREVTAGCWFPAACSRSLILKPGLQLPTPLWREVMLLMGEDYIKIAEQAYEGDEVSGE